MVFFEDEDKEFFEGFGFDLEKELEEESEDDFEICFLVVIVMGYVDYGKM